MSSTYRYPQPQQNISFAWSPAKHIVSRADRFHGVTGGGIV